MISTSAIVINHVFASECHVSANEETTRLDKKGRGNLEKHRAMAKHKASNL